MKTQVVVSMEDFVSGDTMILPLPKDINNVKAGITYVHKGVHLHVEYAIGDERSGKSSSGEEWTKVCTAPYGFVPGILDGDGEDLDFWLCPEFDFNAPIYVIDQSNGDGRFDEHKLVFGAPSKDAAQDVYSDALGEQRAKDLMIDISAATYPEFVSWVGNADMEVPYTQVKMPTLSYRMDGDTPLVTVGNMVALQKSPPAPIIAVSHSPAGATHTFYILTAFDSTNWGPVADTIIRMLYQATESDMFIFYLSSPGGEVGLATRIASGIRVTKARVITMAAGIVASAACFLWAEGHSRLIVAGSTFMQHMSSHADQGKSTDILHNADALVRYTSNVLLKRARELNMFTEEEFDEMINKKTDVFVSGRVMAQRTNTRLLKGGGSDE